jgi:hypothetical protein
MMLMLSGGAAEICPAPVLALLTGCAPSAARACLTLCTLEVYTVMITWTVLALGVPFACRVTLQWQAVPNNSASITVTAAAWQSAQLASWQQNTSLQATCQSTYKATKLLRRPPFGQAGAAAAGGMGACPH